MNRLGVIVRLTIGMGMSERRATSARMRALHRVAALIHQRYRVLGVFHALGDEDSVRVLVDRHRKLPSMPSRIGDVRIHVEPSDVPKCHSGRHVVDLKDAIWQTDGPADRSRRESSITALARNKGSVYVLGCGHGALPYAQRRIRRRFDSASHGKINVILDDQSGEQWKAQLLRGSLASQGSVDYSVSMVGPVADERFTSWHPALASYAPLKVVPDIPSAPRVVWHVSRLPGRPLQCRGTFTHLSLGPVEVELPDGTPGYYVNVMVIAPSAGNRFSVEGESGGLVATDDAHAVGTVLSGTSQESYVLPISLLAQALERHGFPFFFETPS